MAHKGNEAMKRLWVSVSVFCLAFLSSILAYPQQDFLSHFNDTRRLEIQGAIVTRVIDGDTIKKMGSGPAIQLCKTGPKFSMKRRADRKIGGWT